MPTFDVGKEQDLKKFLDVLRENIPKLQEHSFSTVVTDLGGFAVALRKEPEREKNDRYAWRGGWSDIEHKGATSISS